MRGAIHRVTIHSLSGSATNAEGYVTPSWTDLTVPGRASALTDRESQIAAQKGYTSNVAVMVPADTFIDPAAEITVACTGRLGLDGRYRVVEVSGNAQGQRLTLADYDVPEKPSSQVIDGQGVDG